jgi:metal-responsive CopG/Arc/MetJ family transcriptional regulator
MRTIVDLPEGERDRLDALCSQRGISRAEALREALSLGLERERPRHGEVFGLWSDRSLLGVALQRQMRQDWDPR